MNLLAALLVVMQPPVAPPRPAVERTEDVIYGRKHGMALTMDVYVPKEKRNGAAVIFVLSGGWFSSKQPMPTLSDPFLRRGYIVFAVTHGSQPRFTIPEVLEDMHRAVRFIRHNAKKWDVDPNRLGIAGGSAGGHLSLMQGCAPRDGNPTANDPVEKESSRVAAVACFFPPTDFLNYGKPGEEALGTGVLQGFKAPFDFVELAEGERRLEVFQSAGAQRILARLSVVEEIGRREEAGCGLHPARCAVDGIDRLRIPIVPRGGKHQRQVAARGAAGDAESVRVHAVLRGMEANEPHRPAHVLDDLGDRVIRLAAVDHAEDRVATLEELAERDPW